MSRELVERLGAVLDRSKSDRLVAARLGRMHLAQGDDRLAVGLLVEGQQHSKRRRVFIPVGTVIDLDKGGRLQPEKRHAAAVTRSVWRNHVEAPLPANADVD